MPARSRARPSGKAFLGAIPSSHRLAAKLDALKAECALQGVSFDELAERVWKLYQDCEAACRSEAIAVSMAERKRAGRRYCHHAGIGMRWGRRGKEPHQGEAKAVARIVELRQAGMSWYRIAATLLYEHVTKKDGMEWSPWSVRRAFLSAMQRRSEAAADQAPDSRPPE